ncbi:DeoR family transcriptional regulator, partial [Enterococcus faecalis]|nr:DeoR family transcriptional regulator [Enterococcus faecalis]
AETAYVLLDHTKFNEVTFTKVEELESVTLLTDYCPAESLQGFQQKTILMEANK